MQMLQVLLHNFLGLVVLVGNLFRFKVGLGAEGVIHRSPAIKKVGYALG
jgi:hypothetical protein